MTSVADDVAAIQRILSLYAVALDSRAPELLSDCFTPDARLELGGVSATTLAEYRAMCARTVLQFDATQHHLSLPLIDVAGDTARSRCGFVAWHIRQALAPDARLVIGGWYDDAWRRTASGWRIVHRVGTPTWASGNPAVIPGFALGDLFADARNAPLWLEPALNIA